MTNEPATPAPGSAPHTIEMGDYADDWEGQTVTIRPHLSYAADQRIETARIQMSAKVRSGNKQAGRQSGDRDVQMDAAVTPLAYATAVVEECVLSWTLLGYDGVPLPASSAGVNSAQAPAELLDVVIDEIAEFYEARRPKLKPRSKRSG